MGRVIARLGPCCLVATNFLGQSPVLESCKFPVLEPCKHLSYVKYMMTGSKVLVVLGLLIAFRDFYQIPLSEPESIDPFWSKLKMKFSGFYLLKELERDRGPGVIRESPGLSADLGAIKTITGLGAKSGERERGKRVISQACYSLFSQACYSLFSQACYSLFSQACEISPDFLFSQACVGLILTGL
jgi:hypothetical protein